ncbi:hypothetical protein HDV00_007738 [Rhizophlyctis rosea]|nr:hypothetical protein HDV00_007738 [Rhizophlyctis rosea]
MAAPSSNGISKTILTYEQKWKIRALTVVVFLACTAYLAYDTAKRAIRLREPPVISSKLRTAEALVPPAFTICSIHHYQFACNWGTGNPSRLEWNCPNVTTVSPSVLEDYHLKEFDNCYVYRTTEPVLSKSLPRNVDFFQLSFTWRPAVPTDRTRLHYNFDLISIYDPLDDRNGPFGVNSMRWINTNMNVLINPTQSYIDSQLQFTPTTFDVQQGVEVMVVTPPQILGNALALAGTMVGRHPILKVKGVGGTRGMGGSAPLVYYLDDADLL